MRGLTPLTLFFALVSCATPETRMRTALTDAGLPRTLSGCMAKRMARELSIGQLLKLRALGTLNGEKPGTLSAAQYLRRARALGDPEILKITGSAAIGCTLGS